MAYVGSLYARRVDAIVGVAEDQPHHAGRDDVVAVCLQNDLGQAHGGMTGHNHAVACEVEGGPM